MLLYQKSLYCRNCIFQQNSEISVFIFYKSEQVLITSHFLALKSHPHFWSRDTWQNDTLHNDIQHSNTRHNNTQPNGFQHNDTKLTG